MGQLWSCERCRSRRNEPTDYSCICTNNPSNRNRWGEVPRELFLVDDFTVRKYCLNAVVGRRLCNDQPRRPGGPSLPLREEREKTFSPRVVVVSGCAP